MSSFLRAQSKPQVSDLPPLGEKLQPPPLPEGCAQLKHWALPLKLPLRGEKAAPGQDRVQQGRYFALGPAYKAEMIFTFSWSMTL